MRLRVVRLVIVGAGLASLTWIVATSLDRRSYFYYGFQDRYGQWEYPTAGVAMVAFATLCETALLYFVFGLTKPGRIWTRGFVALLILAPWSWWVSEFIVHAPGYWLLHVLWVWLVIASLAVGVVASGLQHARLRTITGRHKHA
jgi:hypothetical protein